MAVSNMGGAPSYGSYVRQQNAGMRAARLGVAQARRDAKAAKQTPQSILDLKNLIASIPTSAMIGQTYDSSMAGLGTEIANLNTGRTANSIGNLTEALAMGLDTTADTAKVLSGQASTYKGTDEQILAAAGAQFNNAKMADIKNMMDQRLNLSQNLYNAQDAFDQRSQAAADKLTQALMSEATAAPDPLAIRGNWLNYMSSAKDYEKKYGSLPSMSGSSGSHGTGAKADGKPVIVNGQPKPAPAGKHWIYQNGKAVLVKNS